MLGRYTRRATSHQDVERDERELFVAKPVTSRTRHDVPSPASSKPSIPESSEVQTPRTLTPKTRRRLCAGFLGLASAIACAVATGAVVSSRRYDNTVIASTSDLGESKATLATRFGSEQCADSAGEGCLPMGKRELRNLVHDCSRRLEVPGADGCSEEPIRNIYRVPFMTSSGDLPCSFETLVDESVIEELASKYVFHFIGASTTRRLSESFVSVKTGMGSPHIISHSRKDYSSGKLEVIFDWAPVCSGDEGIGLAVAAAMQEEAEIGHGKQVVIVTAYGVHDAVRVQEYQAQDLGVIAPGGNDTVAHRLYTYARGQHQIARDGFSAHTLQSCQQLTSQLALAATTGEKPSRLKPWNRGKALQVIAQGRRAATEAAAKARQQAGRGGGVAPTSVNVLRPADGEDLTLKWDVRTLEATVAARRGEGGDARRGRRRMSHEIDGDQEEEVEVEVAGRGVGDGRLLGLGGWSWLRGGGRDGGERRAGGREMPLVFVFQGNPFPSDDTRDAWLSQLHREQNVELEEKLQEEEKLEKMEEEEMGKESEEGGGRRGELFVVDDRESLYGNMACRRADDVHYFEPVKLVEGKMLWHLLALVDRNGG